MTCFTVVELTSGYLRGMSVHTLGTQLGGERALEAEEETEASIQTWRRAWDAGELQVFSITERQSLLRTDERKVATMSQIMKQSNLFLNKCHCFNYLNNVGEFYVILYFPDR